MGHEAVSVLLIDHRGKGWREGELPGWLDIAKLTLSLEPSTARDSGGITQGTSCCFCLLSAVTGRRQCILGAADLLCLICHECLLAHWHLSLHLKTLTKDIFQPPNVINIHEQ